MKAFLTHQPFKIMLAKKHKKLLPLCLLLFISPTDYAREKIEYSQPSVFVDLFILVKYYN